MDAFSSLPGPTAPETTVDLPDQQSQKGKAKDVGPEHCVICLDAISERAITVPCNHYTFDFLCLISWLQECSTCPLCKTEISAVQYDWRSPDDFKTYTVQSTKPAPSSASGSSTAPGHSRPFIRRRNWYGARRSRRSPSPSPDLALIRRRHVYRHELFSMHVGTNRISRYANFTPQVFASSIDLQSRARTFVRRELRVFSFLQADPAEESESASRRVSNAEFLLEYIIAILRKMDIKGPTGQAEDMLQEFIGRNNARLFLHELGAWLRSPYTRLEDWDRHVQYREPLPASVEEAENRRAGPSRSKPSTEDENRGSTGPARSHSRVDSYRASPYQRGGRDSRAERAERRYDPD
ncbi:hypothetical protein SLS56_008892 [Neofusicoccum ribis]|uniref:RING-type E3 ubiquitin transferase n=1 Tax=Neofusicoccum ribis TaxID=45134 RepID=A0ABR3SIX5_9PEZI